MKGAKGGFFDKLLTRFRQRLLKRKLKKEKIIEEQEKEVKKNQIKKKKDEELIINYINKRRFVGINTTKKLENNLKKTKSNLSSNQSLKVIKNSNINFKNKSDKFNFQEKKEQTLKPNDTKRKFKNIKIDNLLNKKILKKNRKHIFKPKKVGIDDKSEISENKRRDTSVDTNLLIKEINKIINNHKELLEHIMIDIENIEEQITITNDMYIIKNLEKKLKELKAKITKILEEYFKIKDGNIENIEYQKINKIIREIKNLDSSININKLIDSSKINLNYYNELINSKLNCNALEDRISYKKEVINSTNSITNNIENVNIDKFNIINSKLENQIRKNKEILNDFNRMISKIEPEKIIEIQSKLISNLIRNATSLIGTFISIPFLKRPKDIPMFTFGLFTLNNSIRNMRAINEKKEVVRYIPSDDYTDKILNSKNNFDSVEYLLYDSINQIEFFKQDFINNFEDYYNDDEYLKQIRKIDSMKEKLVEQSVIINKMKKEYDKTLFKNKEKVLKIKKM